MNKDDMKKIDEIIAEEPAATTQEATAELTAEDLDEVNGGRLRFKRKKWWGKINAESNGKSETGGAVPDGRGASGGW